ncbi:MAG: tetratricopeptide repeat protein [Myxococcota bacterium]
MVRSPGPVALLVGVSIIAVGGFASAQASPPRNGEESPSDNTSAEAAASGDEPAASSPEMDPAAAEARDLFDEAIALTREERFLEALDFYQRSALLVPRASTFFNAAVVSRHLGRYRDALDFLDQFRSVADDVEDADDLAIADVLEEELRARLASLHLQLRPAEAEVTIDGVVAPGHDASRMYLLDPGEHVLSIRESRHHPHRVRLVVSAGEALSRTIVLVPRPDPEPDGSSVFESPWLWTGVGALVVGAVIVAVLSVGASSSNDPPCNYGGSLGECVSL